MKFKSLLFLITSGIYSAFAQNQVPVISNLSTQVQQANNKVIINFNLTDAENDAVDIKFLLSNDGGVNYTAFTGTLTGDVGVGITPGSNKQIEWNYDTVSNVYAYQFRIVADDRQLPNIQDIVNAVDSNRLLSDLTFIQGIRHYSANPTHLAAVKDSIESRFVSAGCQTMRHTFPRTGTSVNGQNIIGRKQGLGEEQTVFIVDAHFDTVNNSPGADDNGSGVAGFLEALRVLKDYNFERTIKFIGFDFEYVQTQLSNWEIIAGVINFEMIGYYSEEANSQQIPAGFSSLFPAQYNAVVSDSSRGNFITNVGDEESTLINAAFDSLAAVYVPDLKVITLTLPLNGNIAPDFRRSDHANFWDADLPALMITDGANFRNHDYHTVNDDIDNLNFTFMSNVVKAAVATLAVMAGIQHSSYVDADFISSGIAHSNYDCKIDVYPVSVKNVLTVNANDCFTKGFTLTLMNAEGKIISSKEEKGNNASIDFKNLARGIYFISLHDGNNRIIKKVIAE
jgi:hypothetical protein